MRTLLSRIYLKIDHRAKIIHIGIEGTDKDVRWKRSEHVQMVLSPPRAGRLQ